MRISPFRWVTLVVLFSILFSSSSFANDKKERRIQKRADLHRLMSRNAKPKHYAQADSQSQTESMYGSHIPRKPPSSFTSQVHQGKFPAAPMGNRYDARNPYCFDRSDIVHGARQVQFQGMAPFVVLPKRFYSLSFMQMAEECSRDGLEYGYDSRLPAYDELNLFLTVCPEDKDRFRVTQENLVENQGYWTTTRPMNFGVYGPTVRKEERILVYGIGRNLYAPEEQLHMGVCVGDVESDLF